MKARVFISLKEGILDPQGVTILKALNALGFTKIKDARVGKTIDLEINASTEEEASKIINDACAKLLANSVIEDYSFGVIP